MARSKSEHKKSCDKGSIMAANAIDNSQVDSKDPYVEYFDWKFTRNREILVFMEETKFWQELLDDCHNRAGVNKIHACQELRELVAERIKYYNSNFRPTLHPKMTPGIPRQFEPPENIA